MFVTFSPSLNLDNISISIELCKKKPLILKFEIFSIRFPLRSESESKRILKSSILTKSQKGFERLNNLDKFVKELEEDPARQNPAASRRISK